MTNVLYDAPVSFSIGDQRYVIGDTGMFQANSKMRIRDAQDGSSHTILVGERGGQSPYSGDTPNLLIRIGVIPEELPRENEPDLELANQLSMGCFDQDPWTLYCTQIQNPPVDIEALPEELLINATELA